MLSLLVQQPHLENHCCRTWYEARGERNCQCSVAVKRSLHRDRGTWVSVKGLKEVNSLMVIKEKMERVSSGVVSGSVGVDN